MSVTYSAVVLCTRTRAKPADPYWIPGVPSGDVWREGPLVCLLVQSLLTGVLPPRRAGRDSSKRVASPGAAGDVLSLHFQPAGVEMGKGLTAVLGFISLISRDV